MKIWDYLLLAGGLVFATWLLGFFGTDFIGFTF